jgi:hypothetical protein
MFGFPSTPPLHTLVTVFWVTLTIRDHSWGDRGRQPHLPPNVSQNLQRAFPSQQTSWKSYVQGILRGNT